MPYLECVLSPPPQAVFDEDILMIAENEYHYMNAVPSATVADGHPVNTHKVGKDQ